MHAAPVEHEDVASSTLMAEALAQLRRGAPLRLSSESDGDDGEDVIARIRPSQPVVTTKRARVVAMVPLARPPQATAPAMRTLEVPRRPMHGFPAFPRVVTEGVRPRLDGWMLLAICLLIIAAFATVALLLSR